MYEDLRFEVADHVGVLTLDRPDARNALRRQTYAELEDVVRTLGERDVRCLVITGADPAFCSGDDVKLMHGRAGTADSGAGSGTPSHSRLPTRCCTPTCPSSPPSTARPSAGAWSWR